ncbi:MAG TPA: hypothetical protein VH257_21775, partial [Chloroflexota bacterium]|nr:hypothetical protein [Chloroflexota bacterium]
EQVASLKALQQQALDNIIGRHGLSAGDADAVLTWGRDDALVELYLLLLFAMKAPSPTDDQKNAVAWVRAVAQRRAVAAAYAAGFEYAKWAGLDQATYTQLMNRNASKSDLQTFLSGQVLNYNALDVDATGGYCAYRSPAPYADEYKGYNSPTCYGPELQIVPNPPAPKFDDFVKYGQAVTNDALLDSQAYKDTALRFGTALGLAVGVAALAYAPVALSASGSLALVTSIFPYYGVVSEVTGLAAGSMTAVIAGYAAGALVVIAALTVAIIQALTIIDEAKLPEKLASLIDDARTTPPAASTLVSATGASSLTSLFVGATLPPPSNRSCDNSDPLARAGVTILKGGPYLQILSSNWCLNPTRIRSASEFDPRFAVTAQGATVPTVSPTITWQDGATGGPATARLSQGWFVRQADGKDVAQSLRFDYTDWDGKARSAWLLAPEDGSYKFLGYTRSDSSIDSTTCLSDKKCFLSPTIEYVGGDGTKYSASVQPYAPPGGIPRYATATTGAPKYGTAAVEGSPLTFEANGFAPAGAKPPVVYSWRFQQEGCQGGPCQVIPQNPTPGQITLGPGGMQGGAPAYSDPVSGATVSHTWGASGVFSVELTATDSAALIGTTTFTVPVGNVPPTLSLTPCAAAPCPARTGDPGAPLPLAGGFTDPGAYNNQTVTIDWGDGSRDSGCLSFTRSPSCFNVLVI